MPEEQRGRLAAWADPWLVTDWLRHRLGLACLQPVASHEFVPCPRESWRAWGGNPGCMFIAAASRYQNRCLKPGRCHA
jgi:hypothetical protein